MLKRAKVVGLGYYVPEKVVTNEDLAAYLDTSDEWIQARIGVKERRVAAGDELSSDLAAKASKMALENAGIKPEDIDMIVFATNMPDHTSPATAIQLQDKVFAHNAFAFDIRVGGCPGLIYGMSIATKYIADGTCKTVLIATADIHSRSIDLEDRLTAVIFGDGSSAVILRESDDDCGGIIKTQLYTDPSGYYSAYVPAGGMAEPITAEGIQNKRHYFKMDGRAIYEFATTAFPETVKTVVKDSNLAINDIDFVISHQANINIIRESMGKLGLPMGKTYCNITKYGNTGGSSVGIAFAEAVEKGLVKKGDKVVLTAFGAGLCWGAVLLQL
ncbi:MAG: ketoacyl-ACP synthase III [Clostridium sp.]|nr:ketoacyl-ACP synthase III [Clostridium sp.]